MSKAVLARPAVLETTGLEGHEFRLAESRPSVRAEILAESIREEADGSLLLRLRVASAYPVRRWGYFDGGLEEFEEVLSFDAGAHRDERLASGRTPLLSAHSTWSLDSVLGVVFDPTWNREEGYVEAACRISAREELAGLRKDVRSRIVVNTSAGYRVYQYRDVTQKGDPRRRLLAIDWEIRECSLVPIGADPTSSTRSAPQGPEERAETATLWTPPKPRERTMDPELETTPAPAASATPATQEPTRAAPAAAPAPAPAAPAPSAPVDPAATERARQRGIRTKLRAAGLPVDGELATRLLDEGVPLERATSDILDAVTRRDGALETRGEVAVGVSDADRFLGQIEDVIAQRTIRNLLTTEERAALDKRLQGNPLVHRRLLFIGERYLEVVHGARDLGRLNAMELATQVLFHRRDPGAMARSAPGFHVTSDFASVLANVANKGLQRMFMMTPDTYSQWVVFGTLPDFKQSKRVNLGDAPRLVRKPEGGEVSFGAVGEKGENVQLLTYARALAISRESLVNDDLGAFMRFPRAFGGASKQLIADLVYSVLTANAALSDGFALFDATNHGNLVTGAGNSLSAAGVAALTNVRALARRQKGITPGNNETPFFLSVDLPHLRVPENLETAAQQLTTSIQAQQVGNVNPFQGAFRSVMAEPRLGAVSQAAFYLMTDPAMMDTIEVDFLEGEQGPVIESRMSWTSEGVEMKCRLDVGVAATEYRGLYKNEGTT